MLFQRSKLISCLFLCCTFYLSAQHYLFEEITKKDGLASNVVNCVFKDSKGYMWFGTGDGGVSRYDGKTFRNYSKAEGLPHNDVRCVLEDKNGIIWFATHGGGISKFDGKMFTNFNHDQGLQNDFVYKIVQDHRGIYWLATWGGGVIRFDGKKFRSYKHDDLISSFQVSMHVDSKGRVWCGGGLSVFVNDTFYTFTKKDGYREAGATYDIDEDDKGNIWFSNLGYGLGKYDGKKFEYFLTDTLNSNPFIPIEISKGNFWIGCNEDKGVIKWDGKNITRIGPKNGLKNASIWSMLYDDEGILWLGSMSGGVYKLKNEYIKHYSSFDGLPEDDIQAFAIDSNSVAWMGFANSGVCGLKKDSVIKLKNEYNELTKNTSALCVDKKNNLFIGSWLNGFFLKENDNIRQLKKYTPEDGLAPIEAYCDDKGLIWIGNWLSCGGEYFDGKKFHEIQPQGQDILSIRVDKKGVSYLSVHGAVLKWKEGMIYKKIDKKEKLSDRDPGSLYIDKFGYLWICHYKGGGISLFNIEKKTWKYLNTKNGLCDNSVKNICEDGEGNIWVATGNGICKLLRPKQDSFVPVILDKDIMLIGKSCNNIIYDKKNNSLSVVAGNEGLYVIPLDKLKNNFKAPRIVLQGINVNYETVYNGSADSLIHKGIEITESENSTSLKLKYNKNNLSFQIAGINLSDPQSVKYSWVLEGFDLKPTPFGKNDQINYTNLPAGEFILKIFAINGLGLKSEKPLEIKIIIVPPFWKTIWFYALVFITTILALVFYIRIREKKLRLTQEILEKTVKERTSEVVNQKHIIEEKQKEIIDSINYAKRIQYTLLAHDEFLKDNLQEHFVYFNPKDIVSGDFYWATKKQNKFYLAVCDSTGHGVPGAFMSLLSIGFLSEAINEKSILEPNKVLDYVRQKLIDNISKEGQKDGFDGILICIDNKKNIITYAAANNTPVLVSEDNIYKLTADKMPVGIGEREQDFQLHTIDVKKGDLLYLYTDGFADQFGGSKGKKFKYKTLNELLFSNYTKTLLEQKEILEESFKGWRGDLEQVDDVCIIGIRI